MVLEWKHPQRNRAFLGKLNAPGWLAGYVARVARASGGWGFREIMEDLPFAAGLQIIHADDYANGVERQWTNDSRRPSFDSLATIEAAFSKL